MCSRSPSERFCSSYLKGIREFNSGEYFACHDTLEELWTETIGEDRDFYQGLIQAAVALFHFSEGNFGGALRMYRSARQYLTAYRPSHNGIEVAIFLNDLDECFKPLVDAPTYPTDCELDPSDCPVLRGEAVTAER